MADALRAAGDETDARKPELVSELRKLEREKRKLEIKRENYLDAIGKGGTATQAVLDRLGEADAGLQTVSQRVEQVRAELAAVNDEAIDEEDLKKALAQFTPVWEQLTLAEKARVVQLLVEEIIYDARSGEITISFRPGGIKTLARETIP